MYRQAESKLVTRELCRERMGLKPAGFRWVFSNGCFDILHAGHLLSLEAARLLGDGLVVGLNSDASVRALKGASRPINPQDDRALVLAGLEAVDLVVIFEETTPLKLLDYLRPAIHTKGGDYRAEELPEYSLVRSWGGEVRIMPLLPGRSTSTLIRKFE